MLCNGPDNPPNCPFSKGDLNPNLIHGSLGPCGPVPKMTSQSVTHERDKQMDIHRPCYSISSNTLHLAIAVIRTKNCMYLTSSDVQVPLFPPQITLPSTLMGDYLPLIISGSKSQRTTLTAVATRMGVLPSRKFLSASSRWCCERSPWIDWAGYPSW